VPKKGPKIGVKKRGPTIPGTNLGAYKPIGTKWGPKKPKTNVQFGRRKG